MTDGIDEVLQERGKRYGAFDRHAAITQRLKADMQCYPAWANLQPDQREALEMIAHKIGRILNGDPNYADSWVDIAGYAKLVADRLEKPEVQFAGAPQQLADAPVDRLRGPLSSGLPCDIDARSVERSGKCVDPHRRT